jgi:hypothetical protein
MEKNYRVKIRKRRKRLFVDRFGGKCQICKYDKCLDSLIFHHVDPTEKEYGPSDVMNFSIERAEKELSKCILVCANCHGELHSEEYDYEINTFHIVNWIEIECLFCHKKFNTKDTSRKFCSDSCYSLSQRRVKNRPNMEELKILISENSFENLGRIYGVSGNSIRKWAKRYNLI